MLMTAAPAPRPDPASARSPVQPPLALVRDEGGEPLRDLGLGHIVVSLVGDGRHRRVDAAHGIRATGRAVLVRGFVEALDRELDRCVAVEALDPVELDRRAGVAPPAAGRVEVALLVAAAGRVVAEDAADAPAG